MHPIKAQYVNDVFNLTNNLCCQMVEKEETAILQVMNITPDNARAIIKKILIALPDSFFYNATKIMLYDMQGIISRDFILFQAQENIDEEKYAYHLISFIEELSTTLMTRYYLQ